jgi:hypothetical protein
MMETIFRRNEYSRLQTVFMLIMIDLELEGKGEIDAYA